MSVEKVNNLSEKSFNNYTGPDNNFKQKNIIFGYNGRGKSSLAKGIINEYLKDDTKTIEGYRFFDRNFINHNLLLKDSLDSRIKGVIANFGKKDVDLENQINELESKLIDTNTIKSDLIDIEKSLRTEINKIHNSKKGNSSIQKKPLSKSVYEIIESYNDDLAKAKKIVSDEYELQQIKGDDSLERQKTIIESLVIPSLNIITKDDVNQIKEIFSREFDDIAVPSSKIVEWISTGVGIHSFGEKCKFCGGSPDLNFIKKKLNIYNSNEKQVTSLKLIDFKEKIDTLLSQIESLLLIENNIIVYLGVGIKDCFKSIRGNKESLLVFNDIVNSKIDDIMLKKIFDDQKLSQVLKGIQKAYDTLITEKKNLLISLNEKIDKISILIKGSIALEINNSTFIKNNLEIFSRKNKEFNNALETNTINLKKIEDLKKSKSNTKDFADHINIILDMIEVNLKLEVLNDDYIIKHSKNDKVLKLEDISEGEQNLLSLLYFYYELFEDNEQINLKPSIELIVIDDPISSMDDINKMYVLELIKKICELQYVQLFILTHVWDDFCNICYNKQDKVNTPFGFYEIKKDANGSKIVNARTNVTPYEHDFKEIYEFSLKDDCSDMTDCEIYHYPNIMRKILEEFLGFKVKNSSPTYSNINNIKFVLCGDKPTSKDEMAIGTLLNVCNILSHKASRNPDEILKSAKFLMKKIENVDRLHFITMKA